MANWINDPQEREEVEKVTQELKLPIFKPNAKGKFRSWLTEVWGKIEDYLINLKNIANSKEPLITKKSGFNLDKTNITENVSNKLFTAKGALDLFNRLTTAISTAVENAKTALRMDIAKKIDKTSKSDSVTSNSSETIATSLAVKTAYDRGSSALIEANKKEPIINKNTGFNKPFGATQNTVLEGSKFTQITGKDYGGLLNSPGLKIAGKAYFDNNTKKLYICKNDNTDISANVNNYIPFDSHSLLERLENFFKFKVINSDVIALKTVFEASFRIEECKFVIVNIDTYSNSPNLLNLSSLTIPYLFLKQGGKYYLSDFSTAYEKAEISLAGDNLIVKSVNKTLIYIGEIYTI